MFQISRKECVTDLLEQDGTKMISDYLASRGVFNITRAQANMIYKASQKNLLTDQQIKERIAIVLEKSNIKNLVGYLVFAMSSEFQTVKEVRTSFHNFQQRNYTDEWFRLFEKSILSPEKMTEAEKLRFDELTTQANG